jgi:hypothetical protein
MESESVPNTGDTKAQPTVRLPFLMLCLDERVVGIVRHTGQFIQYPPLSFSPYLGAARYVNGFDFASPPPRGPIRCWQAFLIHA